MPQAITVPRQVAKHGTAEVVRCVAHRMAKGDLVCFIQFSRKPPGDVFALLKKLDVCYRRAPSSLATPENRGGWYARFDVLPVLAKELLQICPDLAKLVIAVGKQIEKSLANNDDMPPTAGRKRGGTSSPGRITKVCKVMKKDS